MGYDETRVDEIMRILETERNHQVNIEGINNWYAFAYPSFKIGLLSIDILRSDVGAKSIKVVDIGSGGAPMGMLLSRYGFQVFRCDLEPNSLYSGFFWYGRRQGIGEHIACDARLLPFADDSVDVVYSKEFVHHVEDCNAVFAEINRILKRNGVFVMIEPTLSWGRHLLKKIDEHFGHHYRTIFSYYRSLKNNGFVPYRYYVYFYKQFERLHCLNMLKKHLDRQTFEGSTLSKSGFLLKMFVQRLIGGSTVIFCRKARSVNRMQRRPRIHVINPALLVLDRKALSDLRLKKINKVLFDVSSEVRQGTHGSRGEYRRAECSFNRGKE